MAPRNGSGTYSIPNTVVTGTTINSAVENANNADIAAALTDSVSKDGQTTLTGQLKAFAGTVAAPGYTFGSDLDSGLCRIGADNIGGAAGGVKIFEWDGTGLTVATGKTLTADDFIVDDVAAGDITAGSLALTTNLAIGDGGTGQGTATAAFDALAPTTTRGDIITRGAANNGRLAVGTSGQLLRSDGTDPAWASAATAVGTSIPTLVTAGGLQLLTSGNAAGATLDIALTSFTGYRGIKILLIGITPQTDGAELYARYSSDGGGTFDATGYSYGYGLNAEGGHFPKGSSSANQIEMFENVGSAATEGLNAAVELLGQTSTARWTQMFYSGSAVDSQATPVFAQVSGGGTRRTAQDTDAIRFLFSTGNIASGTYAVYGYA